MSISSKTSLLRYCVAALLVLPLVCACQSTDDESQPAEPRYATNQYINLSIVVSNNSAVTRGTPEGDEDGDGRETGFERENAISNVTLMLYQDNAGINTAADTKLTFVHYYPVTLDTRKAQGGTDEVEAVYTTGDISLVGTGIDLNKKYHAIVVANANMTTTFTTDSKVADVRDYITTHLYNGSGIGVDASHFVLSLERDYELDFPNTTPDANNVYSFENIYIERLAARIDFSAAYGALTATYQSKSNNGAGSDYAEPGYVYQVWKTSDTSTPTSADRFVVTSITPFNINTGNEYLFKRTDDATNPYLADETGSNWVVDANGTAKTTAAHPGYLANTLTYVTSLDPADMSTSSYNLKVSALQTDKFTVSGADNMIIAYPAENTVVATSPLYYYATGVAIEGYYYKNDNPSNATRYIYYGFLRHQGEGTDPYTAYEKSGIDAAATCGTPAMNFGVVRNNIYRISIERISEKGTMELMIKVKKWDPYLHKEIWM